MIFVAYKCSTIYTMLENWLAYSSNVLWCFIQRNQRVLKFHIYCPE